MKLSMKEKKVRLVAFTLNRVWTAGLVDPMKQKAYFKLASDLLHDIQFRTREPKEVCDEKSR